MLDFLKMAVGFLQKNAEWMCSIALVFFAFMQWWLSRKQMIQTLRFKRLELAQQLDKVGVTFQGNSETAMPILQFLAENQSSFKFLLKEEFYRYEEELFNFLQKEILILPYIFLYSSYKFFFPTKIRYNLILV